MDMRLWDSLLPSELTEIFATILLMLFALVFMYLMIAVTSGVIFSAAGGVIRDYHGPLFGSNLADAFENVTVHSLLCLPVSVQELLQTNNQLNQDDIVRYFVIDTRPMEQYINGHLPGAFNLDASLIVSNPAQFHLAVQSLGAFKGKTHPTDHLCFMGSGWEQEDQFLHMLVASFLQKGMSSVSLARGGYAALHEVLRESLSTRLKSHNVSGCLICHPAPSLDTSHQSQGSRLGSESDSTSLFGRVSAAVRTKSASVKEKMVDYIVNASPDDPHARHVQSDERLQGRRYRNVASVFSIVGDSDDDDGNEATPTSPASRDRAKLRDWLTERAGDLLAQFRCQQLDDKSFLYPGHLVLTSAYLYILREVEEGPRGYVEIRARRPLANIHKITSKKKIPELLTFKYGYELGPGETKITATDRFVVEKAGDCAKALKAAIVALQEKEAGMSNTENTSAAGENG